MAEIESIVIVKNNYGHVATLRFSDSSKDRIISNIEKYPPYVQIEKYVTKIVRDK